MQTTVCQSPRDARAAIKHHLPNLVSQYLQEHGKDRAWVSCSDVLKHFSLGKREKLMSDAFMRLYSSGPKKLAKPENLPGCPVFVLQIEDRWNNSSWKKVRVFLVERNQFYTAS